MNREYESRAFDAEIDPPVTARSLAASAALLAAIAAGVAGYRLASPAEPPKPVEPPKALPAVEVVKPPDVRAALGGNGPRTDARLPDVDKWLALGARPGARNIVTDNEASRCLGLIKRQFYDKWNPPAQDSRIGKPRVTFRLDSRGFISSPSITQSSGSKEVDDSAISALRQVGRFTGLSSEFISSYGGSFTLELEIR